MPAIDHVHRSLVRAVECVDVGARFKKLTDNIYMVLAACIMQGRDALGIAGMYISAMS